MVRILIPGAKKALEVAWFCLLLMLTPNLYAVKLNDLVRVEGVRDNVLIGYGIAVGLHGTGDSRRSKATLQSTANALQKFGVYVDVEDISSRNVAVVMITANLPAFSEVGNKLDVNVSSVGDARSLSGGTLLLTPLKTVSGEIVALAQGPITTGAFNVESFGNRVQKNHPTVGIVTNGAVIEHSTTDRFIKDDSSLSLILKQPSFVTADRIVSSVKVLFPKINTEVIHAGKVKLNLESGNTSEGIRFVSKLLQMDVNPEKVRRVVINERTGTIVAGGEIYIDSVSVTHGDLRINIANEYNVSQPNSVSGSNNTVVFGEANQNVRTVVVPDSTITVSESENALHSVTKKTSINDLIGSLNELKLKTRDIIVILQSIKRAGALHAEIVVQ